MRNPPVPRQDAHGRRRMQRSEPDKDRHGNRAGSKDQRDRGNGVVGPERKLADQIPRFRPRRDPYRQQQQDHGQPDQRDCQPTQPRNPLTEWGVLVYRGNPFAAPSARWRSRSENAPKLFDTANGRATISAAAAVVRMTAYPTLFAVGRRASPNVG